MINTKYPEHVSIILNEWFQEISQLGNDGKIDIGIVNQIERLILAGELESATKIKKALEKGDK